MELSHIMHYVYISTLRRVVNALNPPCCPRQAEQRKHEEDEQKRQENELAFKAWMMRKREQYQEEKRIHRAQEMERMNSKVRPQGGSDVGFMW